MTSASDNLKPEAYEPDCKFVKRPKPSRAEASLKRSQNRHHRWTDASLLQPLPPISTTRPGMMSATTSYMTRSERSTAGRGSNTSCTCPAGLLAPLKDLAVPQLPQPTATGVFHHVIKWTPFLLVKILLGTIFLLPFRLLALAIIVPIVFLICLPLSWTMSKEPNAHISPVHRYIVREILLKILGRTTLWIFGFTNAVVKGQPASHQAAPFTVIAPHTSIFDIIVAGMYNQGSFITLSDARHFPLVGSLLSVSETIWVDREKKAGGITPCEAIETLLSSPGRWQPIVVFPEGTVHCSGHLTAFKPGVFAYGKSVQPVIYRYGSSEVWTTWTDPGHPWYLVLYHTLCQLHNELEVEYLPVYEPDEAEKADPFLYAENVRKVFESDMVMVRRVSVSWHTAVDMGLCMLAAKLGLPCQAGEVEFDQLNRDFPKMRVTWLHGWLRRFAKMDRDKDGYITCEDLLAAVPWPSITSIARWFAMMDTHKQQRISFRQYAIAMYTVIEPVNDVDMLLDRVFNVFVGYFDHEGGDATRAPLILITLETMSDGFRQVGGYPGCHGRLFHYVSPQGQPCNYATFARRMKAFPDLLVMLRGLYTASAPLGLPPTAP